MTVEDAIELVITTPESKGLMGVHGKVESISIVDENCVIETTKRGIVMPLWEVETSVIRKALVSLTPEDFRIDTSDCPQGDPGCKSKCSVVSTRNHSAMAYAYGDSQLIASAICLSKMSKLKRRHKDGLRRT